LFACILNIYFATALTSDGNFVANSRSPKTTSFAKSLNKVGRQARESVPLLHEIYTGHQIRNLIGNRESQRSR